MDIRALTVTEACTALTCSRTTLYRLIADGQLSALRRGRRTFISSAEVQRHLASLQERITPSLQRQRAAKECANG